MNYRTKSKEIKDAIHRLAHQIASQTPYHSGPYEKTTEHHVFADAVEESGAEPYIVEYARQHPVQYAHRIRGTPAAHEFDIEPHSFNVGDRVRNHERNNLVGTVTSRQGFASSGMPKYSVHYEGHGTPHNNEYEYMLHRHSEEGQKFISRTKIKSNEHAHLALHRLAQDVVNDVDDIHSHNVFADAVEETQEPHHVEYAREHPIHYARRILGSGDYDPIRSRTFKTGDRVRHRITGITGTIHENHGYGHFSGVPKYKIRYDSEHGGGEYIHHEDYLEPHEDNQQKFISMTKVKSMSPFTGRDPLLPPSVGGQSYTPASPAPVPEEQVQEPEELGVPRAAPKAPESPRMGVLASRGDLPQPSEEAVRRGRMTTLLEMLTPQPEEVDKKVGSSRIKGRKIPLPEAVGPAIQPMDSYY